MISRVGQNGPVGIIFADLLDGGDWVPLSLDQQSFPSYLWNDGGSLADAPVDFAATFDGAMWMSRKPIEIPVFNRNPLRVRPNFVVPKHHHNFDEMLCVFAGEYSITYDDGGESKTVIVRPGDVFVSHAGTPYTMTAGPEGALYIETWPGPIRQLTTTWHDVGWSKR
jgi:mannose-6-phosphate isomerase-like protein (cupin superfamily)